jgi:sec-independent protein translocase protein TatC
MTSDKTSPPTPDNGEQERLPEGAEAQNGPIESDRPQAGQSAGDLGDVPSPEAPSPESEEPALPPDDSPPALSSEEDGERVASDPPAEASFPEDEEAPASFDAPAVKPEAGLAEPGSGGDAPPPDEPPDEEEEPDEDGEALPEMSFLEHLEELRSRLVRIVISAIVGMLACYAFSKQMFDKLMEPMVEVLHQSKFIYTYPPEAFFSYIKISLVAGIFLASPYIFYQIWSFVAPALYKEERKWFIPLAVVSAAFFVAGALFGYFIVFPYGFEFFASFTTDNIQFMPKLSEYLGFSLKLLFAFGLVFELPLFAFFLARLGLISSKGMRKLRKYAMLIAFILSAILTPPDPFTQCLMAGPLIILYELSIWVAYCFGKKDKKEREEKRKAQRESDEGPDDASSESEPDEPDAGDASAPEEPAESPAAEPKD